MRLIDADALLKGKQDHEMISTHIVWNAPTIDAEPIVRCKDCHHYEEVANGRGLCFLFSNDAGMTKENAGCTKGRRKNEADRQERMAQVGGFAKRLKAMLKDCRNELCMKCGKYKEEHLGACDGCRWSYDVFLQEIERE